jgi:hypothetical protein
MELPDTLGEKVSGNSPRQTGMQSRMKEPYRKGVANRVASSLAEAVARRPLKRSA